MTEKPLKRQPAMQHVELDADGHLACGARWSPQIARQLAAADGIELKEGHWWLIDFVRGYHQRYGNPPLMRTLVAASRQFDAENGGSRWLYRLFPGGPVRLACKYGGLPKPDWCL
ncbi:MAG: TusE/DsrC/DsvC family sulfur relay protein [Wenzhouxiangella sp.]|nr:MAG: TusE/DsrC/DsvC family sulfur relay protein [Wenzhouxiangella sp.]